MNAAIKTLSERFAQVRKQSLEATQHLERDDFCLQGAEFASPPKWHLAHTSWFFETFLLKPMLAGYHSPEPAYEILFNSYYNGIGDQFKRSQRGLLSRPTVDDVLRYRETVETGIQSLLEQDDHPRRDEIHARIRLGIEHERQHQELFYTDIKYSLSLNPLFPTYTPAADSVDVATAPMQWETREGGLIDCGFDGAGFCFDNELPRHRVWLEPFSIANRLVTNAEFLAFMEDGGYRRPELWLSDGWSTVQREHWDAPLYWRDESEFTLHGLRPRNPHSPVTHVSGYEADAFARWFGARLPTEFEWEHAARTACPRQNPVDRGVLHPEPAADLELSQLYDACWQWTSSSYAAYPGFNAAEGAIGEYNGKFMANQLVLRGGSCVTRADHLRRSYRNFFYPPDRWQFSGIRLAQDL